MPHRFPLPACSPPFSLPFAYTRCLACHCSPFLTRVQRRRQCMTPRPRLPAARTTLFGAEARQDERAALIQTHRHRIIQRANCRAAGRLDALAFSLSFLPLSSNLQCPAGSSSPCRPSRARTRRVLPTRVSRRCGRRRLGMRRRTVRRNPNGTRRAWTTGRTCRLPWTASSGCEASSVASYACAQRPTLSAPARWHTSNLETDERQSIQGAPLSQEGGCGSECSLPSLAGLRQHVSRRHPRLRGSPSAGPLFAEPPSCSRRRPPAARFRRHMAGRDSHPPRWL